MDPTSLQFRGKGIRLLHCPHLRGTVECRYGSISDLSAHPQPRFLNEKPRAFSFLHCECIFSFKIPCLNTVLSRNWNCRNPYSSNSLNCAHLSNCDSTHANTQTNSLLDVGKGGHARQELKRGKRTCTRVNSKLKYPVTLIRHNAPYLYMKRKFNW